MSKNIFKRGTSPSSGIDINSDAQHTSGFNHKVGEGFNDPDPRRKVENREQHEDPNISNNSNDNNPGSSSSSTNSDHDDNDEGNSDNEKTNELYEKEKLMFLQNEFEKLKLKKENEKEKEKEKEKEGEEEKKSDNNQERSTKHKKKNKDEDKDKKELKTNILKTTSSRSHQNQNRAGNRKQSGAEAQFSALVSNKEQFNRENPPNNTLPVYSQTNTKHDHSNGNLNNSNNQQPGHSGNQHQPPGHGSPGQGGNQNQRQGPLPGRGGDQNQGPPQRQGGNQNQNQGPPHRQGGNQNQNQGPPHRQGGNQNQNQGPPPRQGGNQGQGPLPGHGGNNHPLGQGRQQQQQQQQPLPRQGNQQIPNNRNVIGNNLGGANTRINNNAMTVGGPRTLGQLQNLLHFVDFFPRRDNLNQNYTTDNNNPALSKFEIENIDTSDPINQYQLIGDAEREHTSSAGHLMVESQDGVVVRHKDCDERTNNPDKYNIGLKQSYFEAIKTLIAKGNTEFEIDHADTETLNLVNTFLQGEQARLGVLFDIQLTQSGVQHTPPAQLAPEDVALYDYFNDEFEQVFNTQADNAFNQNRLLIQQYLTNQQRTQNPPGPLGHGIFGNRPQPHGRMPFADPNDNRNPPPIPGNG